MDNTKQTFTSTNIWAAITGALAIISIAELVAMNLVISAGALAMAFLAGVASFVHGRRKQAWITLCLIALALATWILLIIIVNSWHLNG